MKPIRTSDYFDFRQELRERGILFCYSGVVTEGILASIGNSLRRKMELDKIGREMSRRMFSVFVEQVQNVIRYSAETTPGLSAEADQGDAQSEALRHGVLAVGKRADGVYFVACSNLVYLEGVERLRSSLDELRGLDRGALTAKMKATLKAEAPEGSRGAGVGFISIAREAINGFFFNFIPLESEGKAIFNFEVYF